MGKNPEDATKMLPCWRTEALSEEAKSFNYNAWLQAMGESEARLRILAEDFREETKGSIEIGQGL